MSGAKPKLAWKNSVALPLHDEPTAVHFARAKALQPPWLNNSEIAVWNHIAPMLSMIGRLKPHFVDALSEYCIVRNRLLEARKYLDENEWRYVTQGRNGTQYKSRPEVAQLNDDFRKWAMLAARFGLTPTDERSMASSQGNLFDDFDSF